MPRVMIYCPMSERPVPTDLEMTAKEFAGAVPFGRTLRPCPRCGATHFWTKEQSWLENGEHAAEEAKPKAENNE
jgi:hypothetical protein